MSALFPELAAALGVVHQCRRDSLKTIRLTELQDFPEKNIKKIVSKLFEQTMYIKEGEIRGHIHGGNKK
jgi:hypothetical protein